MTGYESHYAILAAAVAATGGPILELGCGESSTPMLHYMAIAQAREILSVDTDPKWLDKYAGYKCDRHRFEIVTPKPDENLSLQLRMEKAWREWRGLEHISGSHRGWGTWGVAFVDCAPGEVRHELMIRLAERATIVVAHDSETDYEAGGNYQYAKAVPHFRFVSEWRRWRPYTLVCSNYVATFIEECDRAWRPK